MKETYSCRKEAWDADGENPEWDSKGLIDRQQHGALDRQGPGVRKHGVVWVPSVSLLCKSSRP